MQTKIIDLERAKIGRLRTDAPRSPSEIAALVLVYASFPVYPGLIIWFGLHLGSLYGDYVRNLVWIGGIAITGVMAAYGYVHERVLNSELYKPLRYYSGRRLPVEDVIADAPPGSGIGPASIATDATTTHVRVQTTPSERNAKRRVISIAIVVTAASVWSVACAMALFYAPTSRAFLQATWDRVVDPGRQPSTTPSSQFPLIFDTNAAVTLLMFTAFLVGVTKHLLSRNRSKSAAHVIAHDVRPPVVFLRAFGAEGTRIDLLLKSRLRRLAVPVDFEEVLAEGISRRGPFIAIGSPADLLPRLGAARSYVDDALWQRKATEWLSEARCILVLLGTGDGLAWELEQIRRLRLQGKTIYVLPPVEPQAVRAILERSAGDGVSRTDLPASTQVIAYWTLDDGRRTIVAASRPVAQDYECAIRLAARDLGLV